MIAETRVLLLVGGMGTRLRSVLQSTPKPLASVGDKSFLEILVRQLQFQGFRQLVMCSGYLADQIEAEFGDGSQLGLSIEYSRESLPLGTGGAVKLAAQSYLRRASSFVVMNGDSFIELDFHKLIAFHFENRHLITMAVRSVEDASRYGTVQVAADNRVTGFREKTCNASPGLVNAGVYVFDHAVLQQLPDGPCSLEHDIFPKLLDHGIYAQETKGIFIDIGTPEDYARAQQIRDRLYSAAGPSTNLK